MFPVALADQKIKELMNVTPRPLGGTLIQQAIVKSQSEMFMLGAVAYESVLLKYGALLPGHRPCVYTTGTTEYLQRRKVPFQLDYEPFSQSQSLFTRKTKMKRISCMNLSKTEKSDKCHSSLTLRLDQTHLVTNGRVPRVLKESQSICWYIKGSSRLFILIKAVLVCVSV